jgi:hypothetical protein
MSKGGSNDGPDILDKDGGAGELPDITFFPGASDISSAATISSTRMDYRACTAAATPYSDCTAALIGACSPSHPYCLTDDNLFEWTFGVDVTGGDTTVVQTNCTVPASFDPTGSGDCELKALYDLGFKTAANCDSLDNTSSGLIYVTGTCTLPNAAQVGSLSKPVILVIDNDITVGHTDLFYGMLFVRSPNTAAHGAFAAHVGNQATISGNASGKWFGSIIIEGAASHLNGTMDLIYMDTSAGSPDDPLPDSTRFARLPGSWLDSASGF